MPKLPAPGASAAVPEGSPQTPLDTAVCRDLEELETVIAEREEFRAIAQRLQADFENFRKRSQRQAEDEADRKVSSLLAALLPSLDALSLAVAHFPAGAEQGVEGTALVQVKSLLLDELTRQGLELVGEVGESFDPEHHDAVSHVTAGEHAEMSVVEILRPGYLWRGRVLRPAMVKVQG